MARSPVRLDGVDYVIALDQLRWQAIDSSRQMVDQGTEPGEQSLSNAAIWRRTADDFVIGAGQTYFDLVKESDRRRFRHSKGIDPWTRRSLRLHKSTAGNFVSTTYAGTITNPLNCRYGNNSWDEGVSIFVANSQCYLTIGTDLIQIVDAAASAWTEDPSNARNYVHRYSGGRVRATTNGQRIWTCSSWDEGYTAHDVYYAEADGSNTSSLLCTERPYLLGYANGRLIAAGDAQATPDNRAVLYELSATGVRTNIYTHPSATWTWTVIAAAPNGIYVSGYDGDRSEIYLITNNDATGGLNPPFHVAQLPDGEKVTAMTYYAGLIILGTERGVRIAQPNQSGFLAYGPLIEMAEPVVCFEPQGEYVWFNYSDPDDSTHHGLARLSLARFSEPLLPAWAPDLVSASNQADWQTVSVATVGGRRYFAQTKSGTGMGCRFYGEGDDYLESGSYYSGRVTYGVPDEKVFTNLDVRLDPLPAGGAVTPRPRDEDGDDHSLSSTTETGVRRKSWEVDDLEGEWVEVILDLERGTDTEQTPVVQRWTLRAMPQPFRSEEIWLPIILHEKVTFENRGFEYQPGQAWENLHQLFSSGRIVELVFGRQRLRVKVEGIYTEGGNRLVKDWTDDDDWLEATWLVKVVTVDE